MKIIHVNKFFDLHGGAEVYLHQLMDAQKNAGHDVHVFSTKSLRNLPSKDARYFVERFDLDKREGFGKDLHKARNFLWNTEARESLCRMIRDLEPDVVHLHNVYHHLSSSVLAAIRDAKLPCVMTLHDYKLASPNYSMFDAKGICEHGKGGHYWKIVTHRCLQPDFFGNALAVFEMWMTKYRQAYEKTVDRFLCPSLFIKNKMIEWGEPADKMRYVPNPAEFPDEPATRGGGFVLYAGRLSPEKGLAGFIKAATRVPELHVKIAGRGPEEAELKKLARSSGPARIEFLGFVAPEKLKEIRDQAEAVVLPTISYENASGSLLEAMADGLPCLATKIGGNPELIKDGENGFLVKPGDVDGWETALREFQNLSADQRTAMGTVGRERIKANHLWSQHLQRVLECYKEAGA